MNEKSNQTDPKLTSEILPENIITPQIIEQHCKLHACPPNYSPWFTPACNERVKCTCGVGKRIKTRCKPVTRC
ncbi:unnamed protein product [Trichobilharzia regenti]|uniref:TIL domain-containing protein n=1 Tax=Trichobilharzia regenti TaxID=157069 RepID=A0A183WJT1_TRIRE|nr:unnamed protein product [Trichobilharzia regenti]VDQ08265.1 unnamed protein product [Trichobilharzia regenti]